MSPIDANSPSGLSCGVDSLIFVGFNSRLAALDRDTGEKVWVWKSRQGTGFPAVLLDGDRLIVSVMGYTYCLDPLSGDELWFNELKGMGTGIACLASARGFTTPQLYAALTATEELRKSSEASNAGA